MWLFSVHFYTYLEQVSQVLIMYIHFVKRMENVRKIMIIFCSYNNLIVMNLNYICVFQSVFHLTECEGMQPWTFTYITVCENCLFIHCYLYANIL